MSLESRTPIKDGEWIVTIQLKVGDDNVGDPLTLHYADSYCAGNKSATKATKSSTSHPENVGYLISEAIHSRAIALKPKARKRK